MSGQFVPSPRAASALETGGSGTGQWPDLVSAVGILGERDPIAEAALIRRRLGNYQRGLVSARRVRQQPEPVFGPGGASLFIGTSTSTSTDAERGADQ